MENNIIRLRPEVLSKTVELTATSVDLVLDAATIVIDVAAAVSAVAEIPLMETGLVIVFSAGTFGSGGGLVLTDQDGNTYTFDASTDSITLIGASGSDDLNGARYQVLSNTGVIVA
tara:strand:- start:39 stop:386 length:348 start_codon:yes stop_codon:yes gene_type:complete